jgi:hypothetical protein
LSACSLSGLLRGLPLLPLTGRTESTSSSKTVESCTLAAVCITASGTPFAWVTACRLELGWPRSSGLAPVFSPPFSRGCSPNQGWPWRNLSDRPYSIGQAASGATSRTSPPFASREVGDSRSRHYTRIPSVASARGCRSSRRRRCLRAPICRGHGACHFRSKQLQRQ